jgi:hypothetical protein
MLLMTLKDYDMRSLVLTYINDTKQDILGDGDVDSNRHSTVLIGSWTVANVYMLIQRTIAWLRLLDNAVLRTSSELTSEVLINYLFISDSGFMGGRIRLNGLWKYW